jgi:hypothetical protein
MGFISTLIQNIIIWEGMFHDIPTHIRTSILVQEEEK